jgi:hypothetical protein
MVGVAGSNPVVSTRIHTLLFFQRDAEECRELAPTQELLSAGARAFCVVFDASYVTKAKAASAAFFMPLHSLVVPAEAGTQRLAMTSKSH